MPIIGLPELIHGGKVKITAFSAAGCCTFPSFIELNLRKSSTLTYTPVVWEGMDINMNDSQIKKWMGDILDQKELICHLLAYLDSNDVRKGILRLPQALFNTELYPMVLRHTMPYLQRYEISFSQNMIFLEADLNVKQFGPLRAFYMLQPTEFLFSPEGHHIGFTFREDMKSTGNAMQSMLFNTARGLLSGSFLEKAVSMAKVPGVSVHGSNIMVNLDQMPIPDTVRNLSQHLVLTDMQAVDGALTFRFGFV